MADSIRKQIIVRAKALLDTTPPAGVTIARSRTEAMSTLQADGGAIAVYPLREEPDHDSREGETSTLTLRCECLAKGAEPVDDLLDPLINHVWQRLMGDDATLDGLLMAKGPGSIEWDFETGDEDVAGAAVDFEFKYRVAWQNPTAQI
jgi:hypothetical protein